MKKLALVVGHTKRKKGARAYNGITEYDFNSNVAEMIKNYLNNCHSTKVKVDLFYKDNWGEYGPNYKQCKSMYDLGIELHFNSSNPLYGIAKGCEALVLENDTDSEFLADKLTDEFSKYYKIKQRHEFSIKLEEWEQRYYFDGIKRIDENDRGYHNLKTLSKFCNRCILFEPFFGNFKTEESERIIENDRTYAYVLSDIIVCNLFGNEKITNINIDKSITNSKIYIYREKTTGDFILINKPYALSSEEMSNYKYCGVRNTKI